MIPEGATENNRAAYWYPRLAEHANELNVPDAKLIPMQDHGYEHTDLAPLLSHPDHRPDDYEPPEGWKEQLIEACEDYGTPCFLRSGLSSAKHQGLKGVKVEEPEDAPGVALQIVEHHEMDFLGANPTHWMIRPWIEMAERFRAFYWEFRDQTEEDGLPIPPEYRAFATKSGEHLCTHFYWPNEEFEKNHSPDDAIEILEQMHEDTRSMKPYFAEKSKQAAKLLGSADAWSVDFALGADGTWYLIDVADSRTSWHPSYCQEPGDLVPNREK